MKEVRPWGEFEIILDAPDCKIKRILIKAGHRLSLQRHQFRSETWTCLTGRLLVQCGNDIKTLYPGCSFTIPRYSWHRASCASDYTGAPPEDSTFIEVQTGTSFEETDIERCEDDYGRA